NYLQEIANTVRQYRVYTDEQSAIARKLFQLHGAKETLLASGDASAEEVIAVLDKQILLFEEKLHPECKRILEKWPK
ncbi:hypothetical protein ABTM37_21150, partial [Acinetobacter baumannii]